MDASYLHRPERPALAYIRTAGTTPDYSTVLFCTGFRSDMTGTKALWFEQQCRLRGQGFVRFDYSGHGRSEGRFEDQTIGAWTGDALAVLDTLTQGPVVIAGSSMGGWIALNVALARPQRIMGLLGIAAAPDFTRWMRAGMMEEQRSALQQDGRISVPSEYSVDPCIITAALLDDGEAHCLLDRTIPLDIPMRLVQGMRDADVPWRIAHRIQNALAHPEKAEIILIEDGDHRLSRPQDLRQLDEQLRIVSGIA
jgi:pimeloyl-ACP methyl ester carboxylesterase